MTRRVGPPNLHLCICKCKGPKNPLSMEPPPGEDFKECKEEGISSDRGRGVVVEVKERREGVWKEKSDLPPFNFAF